MIYPLVATGRIAAQVDWLFHAARVEQIYRNLSEGSLFTYIATSTFQKYRCRVIFILSSDLYLSLGMVAFYYNTNSCLLYLGGGIYVYDLRDQLFFYAIFFEGKYLRSFIFALLYTLAPYRLYLGPASFVVGEYIASTFIPLAFLGFLSYCLW